MTLDDARFVTSDDALALLDQAAMLSADPTRRALLLRKRFDLSPERAAAILAVLDGRERAARRGFLRADRLFVTAETIAQATSPALSAWHASLLAPLGRVVDLCCGAGLDTLALASAGASVLAIEIDPARAEFARANIIARGLSERVDLVVGDATALNWSADGGADAVFFDPARRDDAGRFSRHGDRYLPPLSFLAELRARGASGLAKLSPALPDDELLTLGDRVVFVSENRECKEAAVLLGAVADRLGDRMGAGTFGAWLCGATAESGRYFPGGGDTPVAETIGAWLLDPDPAMVRAGALADLCARTGAARISPDDAYLTADHPDTGGAASAWRIRETMLYRPRDVGKWMKGQGIGRVIVKKRRFAREPADVARELGLSGRGDEVALALVADGARHLAVVCDPAPAGV